MPVTAILSLADAKSQLNITTTNSDSELQVFVDAAQDLVELLVGPVREVTVTDVAASNSTGSVVLLSTTPIISLTSVSDVYGNLVDPTTYTFDPIGGTLKPTPNGYLPDGPYTVVYEAGRTVVPAAINLAARLIVQNSWKTQRGGTGRPGMGDDGTAVTPGVGYAIPAMAMEYLSPFLLGPKVL